MPLVKERSVTKGSDIKRHVLKIHGVTGNYLETKGQIDLRIGETLPHRFLVVNSLPMNCELLLGQDWLGVTTTRRSAKRRRTITAARLEHGT